MCLRYSSSVVAPIQRNSPRANCGFSMFAASAEPSALPAPTIVCNSSMNKTICPSAAVTSFKNAFRRSSNSPRYFAPAIIAPKSIATRRLSFSDSGTSPLTTRRARPSAIAVFPTPGSPMSTGLFFVRRVSTCITRRISSFRPITGSIFPSRANAVRSLPYFFSASNLSSGFASVTRCEPRTSPIFSSNTARSTPCFAQIFFNAPPHSSSPSNKCSALRNSSPKSLASFAA